MDSQSELSWGWADELTGYQTVTFDEKDVEQDDAEAEQQEADDARSTISQSDSGSRTLDKFEARFRRIVADKKGMTEAQALLKMRQLYAGDGSAELKDTISIGANPQLLQDYTREMDELAQMEQMMIEKGVYCLSSAEPSFVERRIKMKQMRRSLMVAFDTLKSLAAFSGLQSSVSDAHYSHDLTPEEKQREADSGEAVKMKTSKCQQLIDWLLDQLFKMKAKKKGMLVFRRKDTAEGIWTHSYELIGDIDDVVMKIITESPDFTKYDRLLTSGSGNLAAICKYLEKTYNPKFGRLKEDRGIWSFPNGVFLGKQNATFLKYDDRRLKESHIACKYFEDPRDPDAFVFHDDAYEAKLHLAGGDWMQLETPAFQKIMQSQKGMKDDEQVQRWNYVHAGRLVFDLHQADYWDVQMFYKGLGGTGKSTLLKEYEFFYQPTDVGVLGNELEENFPLESILGCHIYLAFDIGESFRLSQMIWQCMVCAETVPINRKFKTKINVVWIMPGAMAGNQPPNWNDNGGSVSRRMIIWAFLTKVTGSNPWLFDELKLETPILLKKIMLGYLDLAMKYGRTNMEACLAGTPYFAKHRNKLKEDTNILSKFIQTPSVEVAASHCIPLSKFAEAFFLYCDKLRKPRPMAFSEDYYGNIFQEHSIQVSEDKRSGPYREKICVDHWIEGLDLAREEF